MVSIMDINTVGVVGLQSLVIVASEPFQVPVAFLQFSDSRQFFNIYDVSCLCPRYAQDNPCAKTVLYTKESDGEPYQTVWADTLQLR